MPTERFYHLSEGKKALIREAAVKEFCRVPIEKASINKIVQNADISRGSFYTYFEDKDDLLRYVFEDFFRQVEEYCINSLKESRGDFWGMMQKLAKYILDVCREKKMVLLAQTAPGHDIMLKLMDDGGQNGQARQKKMCWVSSLYPHIDRSRLRVKDSEDFQNLFALCIFNLVAVIGDVYQRKTEEAEAMRQFAVRQEYIRYGAETTS